MKFEYPNDLNPKCINDIIKIDRNSFGDEAWNENLYMDILEQDVYKIKPAIYSNKIVAFIVYSVIIDEAELLRIAVNENFRNNNIACNLIKNMIDDLKARDVKKIFLEVNENNVKAINLYIKTNFKTISKRNSYYKNNQNAIIMQLNL